MVTVRDGLEIAGAGLGVLAGLWAAFRWLFLPRLETSVRAALRPELDRLQAAEMTLVTHAEQLEEIGDRMGRAEGQVREHEQFRGTMEANLRHSIQLGEQTLGKLGELAIQLAELRGEFKGSKGGAHGPA